MDDHPILVTGATGFLGGFLAGELIRRGRRTILATGPCDDPKGRIESLLDFLGVDKGCPPGILSLDVSKPGLNLDPDDALKLREVKEVLHCAAVTSFSRRKAPLLESVNIDGTVNVLDMVPGCRHFYHMSTAYVAGKTSGRCLERLVDIQFFNNMYEETKKIAEDTVTDICRERGVSLTIFRPSITYGDSRTGRSIRFNALYYPVRVMLFIRDTMKKDMIEGDGSRASSLGISLDSHGKVNIPVSLPGAGRINLIPVDFLTEAVLEVMEEGAAGIFHIVSSRTRTVRDLVSFIEEVYGITGIKVSNEIESDGALQALVNGYMKVYYPYFCDGRTFDRTALAPFLKKECPVLDTDIFRRCMDYAIEVNWGDSIHI